jgi:uncharacterized protein (TIGR03437 family)
VITTVAGNGGAGYNGDGGLATNSQLASPEGVAVDTGGNLYIADVKNNRIRKVSNGVITTVAGTGPTSGPGNYGGDNGPATSAQLYYPEGVAVDSAGNLYIADTGNRRIRKVTNGVMATVAGNGLPGFSGDNGPATGAQFQHPSAVALDSVGNLYIVDGDNSNIRKVSNGVITTVAGGGSSLGDNGPATSAQLSFPTGVAVDSAGNLYIAEVINNRIRALIPSGPSCSASVSPTALQPPTSGGKVTVAIQTNASCAWALQTLPQWVAYSGNPVGTGSATVTLTIAANPANVRSAVLSIAGISVSVTQQGPVPSPSINIGGVVNAASNGSQGPLAPGSIVTAYGSFLVSSSGTAMSSPLPTSLLGLSMQFGSGAMAPLFYVGAGQVNFQVPWELAGQSQTSIAATLSGEAGIAQTLNLAPFSPGIFSMNSQGTGQGAIIDSSYRLVDSSNPATGGSTVIQVYCTGLGAVTNQPRSGSPSPSSPLAETTTDPRVTIGGAPATVLFSGLAPGFVGEYQVNALVPAESSKGPTVPVVIAMGGTASNTVTIAVQ